MRIDDFWVDEDGGQQLNLSLLQELRKGPTKKYSDLEAAIALARLLHDQFQRYGTDSTQEIADPESREAMRTLVALADRLGVTFSPPFRDLSGFRAFLRCACGARMAGTNSRSYRYYRCVARCGRPHVRADLLDTGVMDLIRRTLITPKTIRK